MARNKALNSRGKPYSARKVNIRETIPRFLILCEGERTEPNYFRSFRVPGVVIEVEGTGQNTVRLVQTALKRRWEDDYDQVWCVFDKDAFPLKNFNDAITLAEREGIRVAYSNEAFELWYILHYEFLNTGISRDDYITKLETKIGKKYKKNSNDMYELLIDKQETAIHHAQKLLSLYNPCQPGQDNPATTVHLLVEELRKFSR
jgi:hypothetical protein